VSKNKGKKQGDGRSGVQQQGEYRLEDGVRHVEPYIFTHSTHAKGRWYGREVLEGKQKKVEKREEGEMMSRVHITGWQAERHCLQTCCRSHSHSHSHSHSPSHSPSHSHSLSPSHRPVPTNTPPPPTRYPLSP